MAEQRGWLVDVHTTSGCGQQMNRLLLCPAVTAGVQFMSSGSAVNQKHWSVSVARDSITFDLHSLCDLSTSVKWPQREADHLTAIWALLRRREWWSLNQVPKANKVKSCWQQRKVVVAARNSLAYIKRIVIYQVWPCLYFKPAFIFCPGVGKLWGWGNIKFWVLMWMACLD